MKEIVIRSDHGPVDIAAVSSFEKKYGISLPSSYKAFAANHDAPWLERNFFQFRNVYSETYGWPYRIIDGIDGRDLNMFGFGNDLGNSELITWNQDFDVFGHENVIAFGRSANGDYICFDYRHDPSTSEPHVAVMFHDAYDEQRKMLICHVANSFEEFMDSLYKSED